MMKRNYKLCQLFCMLLLIVALLLSSGLFKAYSDNSTKNILVLNSYHRGLSWTDQETEGILNKLKEADFDCCASVEYLDWKRYPTEENLNQMYAQLKYKYSQQNIDIIITTDDAALEFALKNRKELFSDAPIVFCGVNEDGIKKLTQGYSRVTGVTEIIDPVNTVRAALEINPELKEIYVIFDNSESGLSTGSITVQAIKSLAPKIKINALNEKSVKDILIEADKAPADSAILITTHYMDPYGTFAGFETLTRKVSEISKVPVFHLYSFGIGNGAIGGSVLCGETEGESAGSIAVRILKGEQISRIPVETLQKIRYIFDYEQLLRFNIALDKIPKGSEVINKPSTFFEEHKSIVITAIAIFLFMVEFIIILAFYLRKISRMKGELQKNHEELKASDNKLRLQFDELTRVQQSLITSEKRYFLLFDKMMNGYFVFEPVINQDGKLVDIRFLNANPGFGLQTGRNIDEIIGKTWMEVYKFPNRNLATYHKILHTGKPEHFETYYPQENKYYLTNAFKISDNEVGSIFENITQYKQAIKEITMLNEELEQRVAERTDELQSAVNELEAFTYTVSHDLKSPLRAVDGYSRLILEDYGPELGEEAYEMVQNIRNICSDMIEMISKLLQYSTTSKTVMGKELIDTEAVFKSIFNELVSAHPDRDIELVVETGLPEIFADKVMMRQAIYNILSNAVKFTKYKEQALITVGCTITGEEYVFYVKDNGVGFDMEYSKKLFGIFQRLHTSDEFEGSGIGLVTVKKIIQRHGGRVWIEGKEGLGASVYFTLPIEW